MVYCNSGNNLIRFVNALREAMLKAAKAEATPIAEAKDAPAKPLDGKVS